MSLLSALAARVAVRRLTRMRRLASDPESAQLRVLRGLVRRAKNTTYGRRHGLDRVRTLRDLPAAIPLRDYAGWAEDWARARTGIPDVSWPGVIRHWAITSGTTLGEKLMPVSDATIRTNRGGGFDSIVPCLAQRAPDLLGGKLLFLGGSISLREHRGMWIGDNTGIMARHVPRLLRRMHAPSTETRALSDWELKIRRTAEETVSADVRMLAGVPSWMILFAEQVLTLAREAGREVACLSELWPRLRLFVHGGVSFAPYAERVRTLFGNAVTCTDTWSASEGGMLAVQDRIDEPGMLPIVDRGVVFEFVPMADLGSPDPTRLPMHAVETGVDYAVVLHSDSGIFGYHLGDVVRFVDRNPLRLVFAGRTAHQLNAFGEHVSSGELDLAMAAACRRTDASVTEYAAAADFPAADRREGRHVFFVEFDRQPSDLRAFGCAVDEAIRSGNEDYTTHRSFGLLDPRIVVVPPGTFLEWMRSRGKIGGQNKIPRVLGTTQRDELTAMIRAAGSKG